MAAEDLLAPWNDTATVVSVKDDWATVYHDVPAS